MSEAELIAETNRLLQQVIDIDARQRAESQRAKAEMDARLEEMKSKSQESMRQALIERGVPLAEAAVDEKDWDVRMKDVRRKSAENMERMREKEAAFRAALLAELKTQSDLLQKIAEKLGT